MKCEACHGTGDGLITGDGKCSECSGFGNKCDCCGEGCPPNLDICYECSQDESR
jgi:RecJ-like exonuclease